MPRHSCLTDWYTLTASKSTWRVVHPHMDAESRAKGWNESCRRPISPSRPKSFHASEWSIRARDRRRWSQIDCRSCSNDTPIRSLKEIKGALYRIARLSTRISRLPGDNRSILSIEFAMTLTLNACLWHDKIIYASAINPASINDYNLL